MGAANDSENQMPKYTANVLLGDDLFTDLVAAPLRSVGFAVDEHAGLNALVVQKDAEDLETFLSDVEARLGAWGSDFTIDDHGEVA